MSERVGDRSQIDGAAPLVQAPPTQLLQPISVGPTPDQCVCTGCRKRLYEGQQLGVYAYQLADADWWDVSRIYCRACTPEELVGPTLGAAELLVTGTLGTVSHPATQSHRLCLVEVLTRTISPPTEGTQP